MGNNLCSLDPKVKVKDIKWEYTMVQTAVFMKINLLFFSNRNTNDIDLGGQYISEMSNFIVLNLKL